MNSNSELAVRLIRRIVDGGVCKSDLARILGVSRKTIYRWLKGECRPTKIPLYKLERLFDLFEDKLVDTYFSRTHGGPPTNYFSFKVTQIPAEVIKSKDRKELNKRLRAVKLVLSKGEDRVLRECLAKLTWLAGILNVSYKVLLDDAALIIKSYLKKRMIKRKNASELALAALQLASFRLAYKLDQETLNQIFKEELVEKRTYKLLLVDLVKMFI